SVNQNISNGRLNLSGTGTWTGAGLSADSTSTVEFYSDFTTGGGTLALTGAGHFGLWAPYLHDSTLTLDPGHALVPDRGTTVLANLTLDGNLDATLWVGYYDYNSGLLQIYGGLTLNGTLFLGAADGSTYDDIFFYGAQSLDGNGAIVFGNNGNNQLHIASS